MRVKCKTRSKFQLLSAETPISLPRVIQYVTPAGGERLVEQKRAKRLYLSGTRTCIGYQLMGDGERPRQDREPESKIPPALKPLSTTFTKTEVQVLSRFQAEESRTARMREEWRKAGYKFDPDKMDLIERTDEKQRVYQATH